ncbi:DOMON domain and Cellobiose dehydrogenase, cytochrome domain-containing protein [Aphelenchoides besseyi]|nr:DOMON domain and Cellobiose dehydrogenase, cytochrome domain-containing protein [Aphelenchoides besseyi]KAI6207868.1 DOMON domain and Cellobiose dehydrogenase, cytochrome domain-containing protein [Aphelenchoides besseyi]
MINTSTVILFGLLLLSSVLRVHGFDRDYCEFSTNDYSLEWAYEPHSANAVFVLKLNTTKPAFWTGVGFNGSRKAIDFVGILVRKGQVAVADAYINSSGVLYTDIVNNVKTIGHEYNGQHLLVKFARPLESPDTINDQPLSGCVTFLMPRAPGNVESHGIQPRLDDFNRFKVCDLAKHCAIDMSEEKQKKKPKEQVKFSKSVDYSGTGDPCSFGNEHYVVNWTYTKPTDSVHFTMKFPLKSGRWWSAVGIGDTMADMDIGIVFVEDGNAKKIGDYLSTSYGVPDQDEHEDWKLEGSTQKNGEVELRFSRAVETKDKEKDRTLDGCVLLQFAANGGRFGEEYSIQKHDDWPDLYKACNIRENCVELNFEKRAKNRKNNNNENEGEEENSQDQATTPATDENRDESAESATTVASDPQTEAVSTSPQVAEGQAVTQSEPSNSNDLTTNAPTESVATTVRVEQPANSHDQPETTTAAEQSEISEEVAGSGEEPTQTTAQPSSESNGSSEPNADNSLDDQSSGQEPSTQESAENEQTTTTVAANVSEEPQQTSAPVVATTETPSEIPTTSQNVEITTEEQKTENTTTPLPTEKVESPSFSTFPVVEQSVPTPAPSTIGNGANQNEPNSGEHCDPQKEDIAVCQSYMNNYLQQVKEWAARHNEPMEAQYGKACALLSAVPHVPQLCCHAYSTLCRNQVSN